MAYIGFTFVEPQLEGHLGRVLGLSAGEVGGMYAIAALFYAGAAILAGSLVKRYDAKLILLFGVSCGVVAWIIVGPFPGIAISSLGLMWFIQILFMVVLGISTYLSCSNELGSESLTVLSLSPYQAAV